MKHRELKYLKYLEKVESEKKCFECGETIHIGETGVTSYWADCYHIGCFERKISMAMEVYGRIIKMTEEEIDIALINAGIIKEVN